MSNRGGLSFAFDGEGALVSRRGAGGLVSALAPGVEQTGATWVAGALSDADRAAAAAREGPVDAHGLRLHLLALDPALYAAYYDVVANSTLWFLHHGLFAAATEPVFDRAWRHAWSAYREVNDRFAGAVAEVAPAGATVLVQDYHLALVPARLRAARPDLALGHFTHTPFCGPDELRALPDDVARELVGGMAAADACGFHTARWAARFEACCRATGTRCPPTFVAPAAPDLAELRAVAKSDRSLDAAGRLDAAAGDRSLVARVDRIELSKNIVRGFLAFDELLDTRPGWRERVVFGAFVYPSRQAVPEYRAYAQAVADTAARVNERWSTRDWTPILLDTGDDFPTSVAALTRFDALLVNPVRDGLNLVAKEGPAVNGRDGVLCLSREAGVFDEVGRHALALNPFDVSATAAALDQALSMEPAERAWRAGRLRDAAEQTTPLDWFARVLAATRAGAERH